MARTSETGSISVIAIVVGALQIFGGGYGLLVMSEFAKDVASLPLLGLVVIAVITVLFLNSIIAGAQLLRRKASGIVLSIINQVLQLVHIQSAALAFSFTSGAYVGMTIKSNGFAFNVNALVSSASMSVPGTAESITAISVNLLALVILIWLIKRRVARRRNVETEV